MPLEKGEVYSSRSEMEENLNDDSFQTLQQKMIDLQAGIDFEQMIDKPLLNSYTKRTDVVLDKMGVQVCLSFDNSQYTNHMLDEISVLDNRYNLLQMEIELKYNILDYNKIFSDFFYVFI